DIITWFDGAQVHDVTTFRLKVADTPVDKRVHLTVQRDGRQLPLAVTLGNRDVALASATNPRRGGGTTGELENTGPVSASGAGMQVRELSDQDLEGMNEPLKGVVVTH